MFPKNTSRPCPTLWRNAGPKLKICRLTSIFSLQEMMEESKLKGEEIMPTLAQRWREEGFLLDKQEVLIMLLDTRFRLGENEKQLIREIKEADKLDAALRLVVTAQTKEEILKKLVFN
jgi:hypothetical protein